MGTLMPITIEPVIVMISATERDPRLRSSIAGGSFIARPVELTIRKIQLNLLIKAVGHLDFINIFGED